MSNLANKIAVIFTLSGSLFLFHKTNRRQYHLTLLLFCAVLIAWLATE